MRFDLPDALIVMGGLALILSGYLIYAPLGLFIAGLELMILGILATRK